ncbi:MAG: ABC transporter substrate-binding protein [Anaerolineales bacterium]|nr:ABC transporter substrate-binding protein [Anaerolineales bacterium]
MKSWKFVSICLMVVLMIIGSACDTVPAQPTTAVEVEPEAGVEVEPETEVEAEPDTEVEAEPEANVEAEPETAAEAEPEANVEPENDEPVIMHIGSTYIWDTANPTIGWYGYNIRRLMYDTLINWGGLNNYGPGLAEEWSVSEDGLVWTFKIREGVTFHDGSPLTANEAAWSLNWTKENEIETIAFYLALFEDIVALDDTTLQITLSQPVGNMITALVPIVWMFPQSVWDGKTYDEFTEMEDLEVGLGSGPYKLVEWVEGEYLILDAYENYWGGKPPIDRIIYHEYATGDAVVQALLAGEVDVTETVPSTAIKVLEEAEDVHVAIMDSFIYEEFIINSHEDGTQPKCLLDPDVRLAMAHAINKQQIVNVAYLGYSEPGAVIIPTAAGDWHNGEIQDIPFDIAEGNRILDEAGYLDSDNDGIREDLEGNPMDFRFYGEEGSTFARMMEIISDGLAEIGIIATPTLLDTDSMIALYPDFDFDLLIWNWSTDGDPDFALRVLTCAERVPNGWNDSGYCNEAYDELYELQAITVDHEERKQIIWDMQEMIFNDRPYIVLEYPATVAAYRSDRFLLSEACGGFTWKKCMLESQFID